MKWNQAGDHAFSAEKRQEIGLSHAVYVHDISYWGQEISHVALILWVCNSQNRNITHHMTPIDTNPSNQTPDTTDTKASKSRTLVTS